MNIDIKYSNKNGLDIQEDTSKHIYKTYETRINNMCQNYNVSISKYKIRIKDEDINNSNEEYPFINFRDITYFPLTWKNAVTRFGWEYNWSDENGLVINSRCNENLDPKSFQAEIISLLNKLVYKDSFEFELNITPKLKKEQQKTIIYFGKKLSAFDDTRLNIHIEFDDLNFPIGGDIFTLNAMKYSYNLPTTNASSIKINSTSSNPNSTKQFASSFLNNELYKFVWYFSDVAFVNDLDKIKDI